MKTLTLTGYEPRTSEPTPRQRAEYSRDALARLLAQYTPTGEPLSAEHGTATLTLPSRAPRPLLITGAIAWTGLASLPFAAVALGLHAFAGCYAAVMIVATLHLALLLRRKAA